MYKKYLIYALVFGCSLSGCAAKMDSNQDGERVNYESAISQPIYRYSQLIISQGCTGCGRCAMIDESHFSVSGRQIKVISQESLDSNSLQSAIRACPANAIILS